MDEPHLKSRSGRRDLQGPLPQTACLHNLRSGTGCLGVPVSHLHTHAVSAYAAQIKHEPPRVSVEGTLQGLHAAIVQVKLAPCASLPPSRLLTCQALSKTAGRAEAEAGSGLQARRAASKQAACRLLATAALTSSSCWSCKLPHDFARGIVLPCAAQPHREMPLG